MFLVDAYNGKEPLWRVFWLYGVFFSTVVTTLFLWVVSQDIHFLAIDQVLVIAFIPYTVWLLISIWRCAFNVSQELYGHIGRALTVAWALNAALLVVSVELDVLLS